MRGWFVSQVVLLIGALGLSGAARSQDINSGMFSSAGQAERYLRQNPNGPHAKAAFLAIVEFQLARENPGFSRAAIANSINLQAAKATTRAGRRNPVIGQNGGGDLY